MPIRLTRHTISFATGAISMRLSLLLLLLSATAASTPASGAERTFTIEDRQYQFDFPAEIKFESRRSDVSTDGFPIEIVAFSTPRSTKEYFQIHFVEVKASFEQVVKGYDVIQDEAGTEEAKAANESTDDAIIERMDGFYRLGYAKYDDFRTMDILIARSKCPSACAIVVQFMYFRENPYGFGAPIVNDIKQQLLSGQFLPR